MSEREKASCRNCEHYRGDDCIVPCSRCSDLNADSQDYCTLYLGIGEDPYQTIKELESEIINLKNIINILKTEKESKDYE